MQHFIQVFVDDGDSSDQSQITAFTTPYAVTSRFHVRATMLTTVHSVSYLYSLTAILVSRFLMNLQEANLRSVKVDSDDSLHFSTDNSLQSFAAAVGVYGSPVVPTGDEVEGGVGRLGDEETGGSASDLQYNPTEEGEIQEEAIVDGATCGVNV